MRILREPGGCPWDMEQTHESIKKNFIEETYEAVSYTHLDVYKRQGIIIRKMSSDRLRITAGRNYENDAVASEINAYLKGEPHELSLIHILTLKERTAIYRFAIGRVWA